MKKLFVSVPMRGRKEEDIKKSYEIAKKVGEAAWGEKLELIESFIKNDPPATNNIAIYMLGESIKKLAAADYYIGVGAVDPEKYPGCLIERLVCNYYDITNFNLDINIMCPDLAKEKNE